MAQKFSSVIVLQKRDKMKDFLPHFGLSGFSVLLNQGN